MLLEKSSLCLPDKCSPTFNIVTHIIYSQRLLRKFKHLSMFTWSMKCSRFGPGYVLGLTSNISTRVIIKLLGWTVQKHKTASLELNSEQIKLHQTVCPRHFSKAKELPVWSMMGK